MTLRLTFGIDPGKTGAIVTLIDGEPGPMLDMPVRPLGEKTEVDAVVVAMFLRQQIAAHAGAYVSACMERVSAAPMNKEGRKQGTSSMFAFGDSSGAIRGVLETMRIQYTRPIPAVWKRHFALIGTEKDAARTLAVRRFPAAAKELQRKKDSGRADALLLALWHESNEMRGARAA